jgi:hypothetical protein
LATIVFLEHLLQDRLGIAYMAYEFAHRWEEAGHRVLYHRGTSTPPPGDVAILHVDLTVVPQSYRDLARHYPRVVNAATGDIRKSLYNPCVLKRGEEWGGQVIIKTEANHGGHIDDALRRMALDAGLASDVAVQTVMDNYYLCASLANVPEGIWSTPGVIVEKFVPEREGESYHLRIWTFFGKEERSSRYRSREPLVRSDNYLDRVAVPVPEELRETRARLGFDFGKFDYVMHEGRCMLLDANRTPGAPSRLAASPEIQASFDRIATGINEFLPAPA